MRKLVAAESQRRKLSVSRSAAEACRHRADAREAAAAASSPKCSRQTRSGGGAPGLCTTFSMLM